MTETSLNSVYARAATATCRFGLGARPGELQHAKADPRGWLKSQITVGGGEQPAAALPTGQMCFEAFRVSQAAVKAAKEQGAAGGGVKDGTGGQPGGQGEGEPLKAAQRAARQPLRELVQNEIAERTRIAVSTEASFRERWTLFWANHFTVSTTKPASAVLAGAFEREAVRPHVFGRFETLLVAASTHPGMLLYLDEARSTGPNSPAGERRSAGLNENLGREILELHTVGADAGYTQADVNEFARALTGYSIGADRDGSQAAGAFVFRRNLHEPGVRTVMGRRYPEAGADQARAVMADLAANPKTARHVAQKLAAHFVSDAPPPTLVAHLQSSFLESGGDLAVLAGALIDAPEAWDPSLRKFKRPSEFLISSYRAVGAEPVEIGPDFIQPLTLLGERPLGAPQPNGWPDRSDVWMQPDAIVKRLAWASRFSAAQASGGLQSIAVAQACLGPRLSPAVGDAMARATTGSEGLALLLMSPEFQRR